MTRLTIGTARGVRLAAVALTLAALTLALSAGRATGAEEPRFTALDQAIEAGALDPAVLESPGRGGALEGFVILAEAESRSPAEAKRSLIDRYEGRVEAVRDYESLAVALVRFDGPETILDVLNDPLVAGVGADRENVAFLNQSLPLIRQPAAQALGLTGAGTSIAILDTGVDFTRAAFGSCTAPATPAGCRVAFARDFAPDDQRLDDPTWPLPFFHGTNVAGIALGVAPGAQILALDVFDGTGAQAGAWDRDILAAIDWVIANQAGFNIRALNMSLGYAGTYNDQPCGGSANPYVDAFARARARGVLPVVSSGNFAGVNGGFVDGIANPACTPGAVSVGAVYDSAQGTQRWQGCTDQVTFADQIVCFSQSGQALTMLAPGAWIQAAGVIQAGTSQAAPHVAGAAAVLAAAAPQATLGLITDALTTGPPIIDQRNGVIRPRLDLELAASLFRCDGAAVTIRGTRGNDHLVGTPGDDVIAALGGDDVIEGLGARDRICGGQGNDVLDGGGGPDVLLGEDGEDTLRDGEYSCTGNLCAWTADSVPTGDVLSGGAGRDRADYSHRTSRLELSMDGAANDGESGEGDSIRPDVEFVVGGSGGDWIVGSGGDDTLSSGPGDDEVVGLAGADSIDCGPGTDFVHPDAQDISMAGCEYVGHPFKP